jgi:hypothetical protein
MLLKMRILTLLRTNGLVDMGSAGRGVMKGQCILARMYTPNSYPTFLGHEVVSVRVLQYGASGQDCCRKPVVKVIALAASPVLCRAYVALARLRENWTSAKVIACRGLHVRPPPGAWLE